MLVWGFIALSMRRSCFYQRCFAAKDKQTAKKGILISCCVWIVFDLSTTLGAMYAKAVYPSLNPAKAYMFFAIDTLPSGLRGFFLAGVLATILSTMDSYFNIASTSLSYDLFTYNKKSVTGDQNLLVVCGSAYNRFSNYV